MVSRELVEKNCTNVREFSTCASGSWKCSKFACPRTCTVMGNGHIDTFDGKTYNLMGSCRYTLLEVSDHFIRYIL